MIHFPGVNSGGSTSRLPAEILSAFQNYILFRKVQCTPLTHITLNEELPLDAADSSETNSTTTPTSKAKAFFNDVMTKLSKDDGKPDSMFVKRLKNLIEEKKEWYEERKRRAASKGSKMNKPKCQELDSSFDNGHIQTDQSDSDEVDAPRSHREVASRPKHAIFGTKTMAPDESGGERADDAAPSTLGRLIRRRLWADRSGKSTESDCQNDEVATSADPERQQQSCQYNLDQINQGTGNRGGRCQISSVLDANQ